MTGIVIDTKKYVLVPEKYYTTLQIKAALKTKPDKRQPYTSKGALQRLWFPVAH